MSFSPSVRTTGSASPRSPDVPLDPQAAAFLEQLRELGAPPHWEVGVTEARRRVDEAAPGLFGKPDPVASVEDADADGVPLRVYHSAGREVVPALVWFHGGGWALGSLASHDGLCRTLAARSGCAVVAADYRLAPEDPYPAAVEDAWTATLWASRRFPALAVGGDSAGGHLAAVTALSARDRGLPLSLQVLVYPVTDAGCDTPSYGKHAEVPNLTAEAMRWFWDQFCPDARRAEPEASVLRARDLRGVAPALVLTAEYDVLRDEGEAYARRLVDADVPVTLTRYDGQIHGFLRMPATIERANHAIDEVAEAIRTALAVPVG
jgi:acetyl esterase